MTRVTELAGRDRYAEAVAATVAAEKASASFLQRKLYMGWNEAKAYLDRMQAEGLIGKPNHIGMRKVLVEHVRALESAPHD